MVSEAELGTAEAKIADFKIRFQSCGDEQLRLQIAKWGDESRPERIAASLLLQERQDAEESKRHVIEIRLSKKAIGISVLALFVAFFALWLQWRDSPSYKTPTEQARTLSKEEQPPPQPSPVLANPVQASTSTPKLPQQEKQKP